MMHDALFWLFAGAIVGTALVYIFLAFGIFRYGVPFIPSQKERIRKMLDFADIKPGDTVYDLGCGDGRLLFFAAQKGARAIGHEAMFPLVFFIRVRNLFTSHHIEVHVSDFFKENFEDADVIFCYLSQPHMQRIKKEIYPQLPKGARIISNVFHLPGEEPEKSEKMGRGTVYVYRKK